MYVSAFVLGFHGCDEGTGEQILAGRDHLKPSGNSYDWLGHGTYFWENSPRRALQWAEFIRDNQRWFETKITKPFVVGAIIDLGRCLDLSEASSLELIQSGFGDLKAIFDSAGVDLPQNEAGAPGDADLVKRHLDCAVINNVHALRKKRGLPEFDTVRGAFWEGAPLYAGAKIMAKTHVQIAVRHSRQIRGYFRPILEGDSVS